MENQMTKARLLESIEKEHEQLETILGSLDESQFTTPGAGNGWSIKDILAHITAWERKMCLWLEESLAGKIPQRPAPGLTWDDLDLLNQQIFEQNREKTLDEVLAEFKESYTTSLAMIKTITEEDLIDPDRFAWREGEPLWKMIAGNTYLHYREHFEFFAGLPSLTM